MYLRHTRHKKNGKTLDRRLPHKAAIERHLVRRFGELFDLDYELLLYDVTSSYFEGSCAAPSLAQRGYSRDHRPDCLQVNIALVVTRGGMPLGYEIFPGNTADVTTVEEIVSTMERRFGRANRVWVMDRGMVSAENIAWLNATGRRYVIGTPRSELKRWATQLADRGDWRRIRQKRKDSRIQAHILVCFLGYALWKTLQQWQSRAGLSDSPRTIHSHRALAHYGRQGHCDSGQELPHFSYSAWPTASSDLASVTFVTLARHSALPIPPSFDVRQYVFFPEFYDVVS